MSENTKTKFIRDWLNKEESSDNGWYKISLEADSEALDCTVTIADCSRSIHLDLSSSEREYYKSEEEALEKLDRLIGALTELKDSYSEFYEFHRTKRNEKEEENKV